MRVKLVETGMEVRLSCSPSRRKSVVSSSNSSFTEVDRSSEYRRSVLSRSLRTFRDIASSNEFAYFVTFTLSERSMTAHARRQGEIGDSPLRQDVSAVLARLQDGLSRARKLGYLHGYLLAYDLHDDNAIHFHGFINFERSALKFAGFQFVNRIRKRIYYSPLLNRLIGRNQFSPISPSAIHQASFYAIKYASKAFEELGVSHPYLCSHGLKRSIFELAFDDDSSVPIFFECLRHSDFSYSNDFGVSCLIARSFENRRAVVSIVLAWLSELTSLAELPCHRARTELYVVQQGLFARGGRTA